MRRCRSSSSPATAADSVNAFPVRTRAELEFFTGYVADAVVQEFLSGPEYTIDMLCGRDGRPISIVPRERTVIRAGVTDRGRTVCDARLIDIAERCAAALDFFGAVNVQCRIVEGVPSVFEINPRFSAGIRADDRGWRELPADARRDRRSGGTWPPASETSPTTCG